MHKNLQKLIDLAVAVERRVDGTYEPFYNYRVLFADPFVYALVACNAKILEYAQETDETPTGEKQLIYFEVNSDQEPEFAEWLRLFSA